MNYEYLKIFIIYFIGVNLFGFLEMGIDKYKAKHHMWRIPENTLLLVSFLGGSIGSFIGMKLFRHKTLHPQFKYGIPAFFIINIITIYFIFTNFIIVKPT